MAINLKLGCHMNFSRMFVILGLVIVGVLSRLLPHPPNFTSVNAIALFGAFYFESKWLSFATVVATLLLSDLAIGFYPTMSFVYLSFGLIVLIGSKLKKKASFERITITSLASSVLFFIVTNFGDWLTLSLYPKTLQGLGLCYFSAIPFFVTQLLGDLCYGFLLFGMLSLYRSGFKGFDGIVTNGKN